MSAFLYKLLFRRLFFALDPEKIHDGITYFGEFLGRWNITKGAVKLLFDYRNGKLEQNILGIKFSNPIGLAAGFDKDARLIDIIPSVGFGFEEVGSITGEPCRGNSKPRLWRLPKSKGLVVHYGLKNEGCELLSRRLSVRKFTIPLGTNIAKTNSPETADTNKGISDYIKAFKKFAGIGDYFTINISCPNAFGGEPFTDPERLGTLLNEIDKIPTDKPIFLKISPDLTEKEIDAVLETVKSHRVHGFICGNLTKNRNNPKLVETCPEIGGISGKPLEGLANDLIRYVYKKTAGRYVIIGCGGVFSAEDAYKKIGLGASFIQLITGMIFEGPQLIGEINRGLVRLLEKDGFSHISEAVGSRN